VGLRLIISWILSSGSWLLLNDLNAQLEVLMKYRRIEILFVLVGLLMLFSCSENPEQKRDKHMERGDAYYEKQEYKKAIIEYKNVIQATGI
jgi:hypothetical protein